MPTTYPREMMVTMRGSNGAQYVSKVITANLGFSLIAHTSLVAAMGAPNNPQFQMEFHQHLMISAKNNEDEDDDTEFKPGDQIPPEEQGEHEIIGEKRKSRPNDDPNDDPSQQHYEGTIDGEPHRWYQDSRTGTIHVVKSNLSGIEGQLNLPEWRMSFMDEIMNDFKNSLSELGGFLGYIDFLPCSTTQANTLTLSIGSGPSVRHKAKAIESDSLKRLASRSPAKSAKLRLSQVQTSILNILHDAEDDRKKAKSLIVEMLVKEVTSRI